MSEKDTQDELFDAANWYEQYKKQAQASLETATQALRDLAPRLKELGVTEVHAEYDGAGDSGDFEAVYAVPEEKNIETALQTLGLKLNEFHDLLWPLLPAGWEINEGSYGVIILNTETGKIFRGHNERIEEVNTTEDEL